MPVLLVAGIFCRESVSEMPFIKNLFTALKARRSLVARPCPVVRRARCVDVLRCESLSVIVLRLESLPLFVDSPVVLCCPHDSHPFLTPL